MNRGLSMNQGLSVNRPSRSAGFGRPRRSRGATLIEVLIAVLVLAVGILGLMGLQINGKRTTYEALQRSAAVNLAQDMINRMRANPNVAPTITFLDDEYDTGADYDNGGVGGGQVATPAVDCAEAGAGCTRVYDPATVLASGALPFRRPSRSRKPATRVHAVPRPMAVTPTSALAWASRSSFFFGVGGALIARTGYTGEDGFELFFDAEQNRDGKFSGKTPVSQRVAERRRRPARNGRKNRRRFQQAFRRQKSCPRRCPATPRRWLNCHSPPPGRTCHRG